MTAVSGQHELGHDAPVGRVTISGPRELVRLLRRETVGR